MRGRITLILISLWLFLSLPFNVVTLKLLIRYAFWQIAHLSAGLDRALWLQHLLATIFIAAVAVLLVRRDKIGRTLAVVVLLGSCCEMLGFFLCAAAFALLGGPYAFGANPKALMIVAATFLLNVTCLLALRQRV
jgi:hypothetical protein